MSKFGRILALFLLVLSGCGVFKIVDPQEAPGVKLQNPGFEEGAGQTGLPQGWGGNPPGEFEITIDQEVFKSGMASARIKSVSSAPKNFATVTQCLEEIPEGAKLFSLSGFLRVENVASPNPEEVGEAGAGLWANVTDRTGAVVAADNMNVRFDANNPREVEDRRLYGSLDWNEYTISVELPESAAQVCFGLILSSAGTAWADDIEARFLKDDGE